MQKSWSKTNVRKSQNRRPDPVFSTNKGNLYGVTTYGNAGPTIWITFLGVDSSYHDKNLSPGEVVFHEAIHRFLRDPNDPTSSSHETIVDLLGIEPTEKTKDEKGNEFTSEGKAAQSLTEWIDRGCKKRPVKRGKK